MTGSRRWVALSVVSVAQLMVALDATIMNIALPSAQQALHPSDADRQWVVTAYTLAFAGLLLLGGRIADYLGRKRVFLTGLAGFMAASAVGGAAVNFPMLVAGRALQGAFAAVLTPTALSLLAVTFTEPKERARAFAVYGAIAGGGGAVGLLAGGPLMEFASWRWCLYVNMIIGLAAGLAGLWVLADGEPQGRQRFDVPGVLLVTSGLVAVVYACTQAAAGWGSAQVIVPLGAAVLLLASFVFVRCSRAPPPSTSASRSSRRSCSTVTPAIPPPRRRSAPDRCSRSRRVRESWPIGRAAEPCTATPSW
ncbi:MFS transporter [Nonomuraea angiospora]|uniref:MFS transporter n=1 Tax=Nonomuraea angiospora TaxID=46172 RepID=UPI0033DE7375